MDESTLVDHALCTFARATGFWPDAKDSDFLTSEFWDMVHVDFNDWWGRCGDDVTVALRPVTPLVFITPWTNPYDMKMDIEYKNLSPGESVVVFQSNQLVSPAGGGAAKRKRESEARFNLLLV